MKENRKTIKIKYSVHRKLKLHVTKTGKNIDSFTESAIENQIKTDRIAARILKSIKD